MNIHHTCSTCRFFADSEKRCHRNPPQATIVMIQQPPSLVSRGQNQIAPVAFADWPPIGNPDEAWCGDHETRLASIQ